MSEKRFKVVQDPRVQTEYFIYDNENKISRNIIDYPFINQDVCSKIVMLLNEQQELIEELHTSDEVGWGRAEKFEKELKQKKIYIKRLEYKVQKFKEMNGEQQAIIKSKDKQLERLYNYFQDYLKDEMSSNAFSEMWDFVKEDEKWGR